MRAAVELGKFRTQSLFFNPRARKEGPSWRALGEREAGIRFTVVAFLGLFRGALRIMPGGFAGDVPAGNLKKKTLNN